MSCRLVPVADGYYSRLFFQPPLQLELDVAFLCDGDAHLLSASTWLRGQVLVELVLESSEDR